MSEIAINYKGNSIATMDASGTKTLLTSGKYCEDDIEIIYTRPSGGGGGVPLTVKGSNIAINNEGDTVITELSIDIVANQSGSGDPSTTNIRPISGFGSANIYVSPTNDSADGDTYTISFGSAGTVYGGVLNVTTGELIVDKACISLRSQGWNRSSSYPGGYYMSNINIGGNYGARPKDRTPFICSHAITATALSEYLPGTCFSDSSLNIRIMSSSSTLSDWQNYLEEQYNNGTPVQACFTLNTPLEYNLTPEEVDMLLGSNNIWADTGDVTVTLDVEGGSSPTIQSLTVTPTTSQQTFNSESVDGYKPVTVNAIPSEYIIPTGNKAITENGTGIDVAQYETVSVNVSGTSKNVQVLQSTSRTNASSLTKVLGDLTVSKTGTYDIYWSGGRSNTSTSYTWGTRLYVDGSGYGTENTSWSNNCQSNHLSNVSLTAGQKLSVYARGRTGSYYTFVPMLVIVEA